MVSGFLEGRGQWVLSYISWLKQRYLLGENSVFLPSLTPPKRSAANAEPCDELREHTLRLHKQLIKPLVGKTEADKPPDTLGALKDFTGYVALFPLGKGF